VVIETTWAEALFTWSDGDGAESAAMPLSCLSRYIVQGCVVLSPQAFHLTLVDGPADLFLPTAGES